jgi:hypothetical protein
MFHGSIFDLQYRNKLALKRQDRQDGVVLKSVGQERTRVIITYAVIGKEKGYWV